MPTISMFYGILVSMYALDIQKHHRDWALAATGETPYKIDPLR